MRVLLAAACILLQGEPGYRGPRGWSLQLLLLQIRQFVGGHMAASRYFPVIAVLSSLDVPARSVLERLRRERGRNVCRRAINDARYAKNRGRKRPRGKLAVACLAHLCGAGQLPRAALLHDTGCVRSHHLSVRSPFTTPAAAGTLVLGYGPRHKN